MMTYYSQMASMKQKELWQICPLVYYFRRELLESMINIVGPNITLFNGRSLVQISLFIHFLNLVHPCASTKEVVCDLFAYCLLHLHDFSY